MKYRLSKITILHLKFNLSEQVWFYKRMHLLSVRGYMLSTLEL